MGTNEIVMHSETPEEEQRRKEELNHENFREWFNGLLREITVDLKFVKSNGEIREMKCTLKEDSIPNEKRAKGDGTRKSPVDSVAVFDVEKQDWRSFRYDSILEFSGELPENYPLSPQPVVLTEGENIDE